MATTRTIYGATVTRATKDRHTLADISFEALKRENFPSDDAYRTALEQQYRAMREQEYLYVVQDEALKAYNVSSGANKKAGRRVENDQAWQGYASVEGVRDTSWCRTVDLAQGCSASAPGRWCCAISASSLTMQISGEMGYDGDQNLIKPKSRIVRYNGQSTCGNKNSPGVAGNIHLMDSIPEEYRISYENSSRKPTLNEAVKQGILNVGDEFAIETGQATENTSGCHAMVITDIKRDADGHVTHYTIQANNPPCLKTIDANHPSEIGRAHV